MLVGILFAFPMTIVTAIVSPKALPNDSKKPANIPLKENGRITPLRVSNSVAPKEIAPSFTSFGTSDITSFPIEAEYGIIIIDKIIEAVNIPTPIGWIPNFVWMFLITGARIKSPHKPIMTDGIPAINSTKVWKILKIVLFFKISLKKIEIERENGTEIKRDIIDVRRVPIIKGNAPNLLFTGSQLFENRKLIPNSLIDGKEEKTRLKNIPATSIIIRNPDKIRKNLKILSFLII